MNIHLLFSSQSNHNKIITSCLIQTSEKEKQNHKQAQILAILQYTAF